MNKEKGFNLVTEKENGMIGGTKLNVERTLEHVIPLFNLLGFGLEFIRGQKDVMEYYPVCDSTQRSRMCNRFLTKGSGLLMVFYDHNDVSNQRMLQVLPIKHANPKCLKDRPRLSCPGDIYKATTMENRIPVLWGVCHAMDLYYFIPAYLSQMYALNTFSGTPMGCWNLNDRYKPGDRMSIKSEYQISLFKSYSELQNDLRKILKIKL